MVLEVVQSLGLQHAGGHVLVLDALVGQNGRGEVALQFHVLQPLHVEAGDGVVAAPQLLEGLGRHSPQDLEQMPGLGQKLGSRPGCQAVPVGHHFFGG